MFSKLIFVLVTVYIVNASVISDNVFDDDPETEVASNPKGCNYRECDQRCRRLRFPGGACVNGRCKCDKFLNAEDEISDNTLLDLEDLVSLKEDDPGTEVAKGCNYRECDQRCRRLKFPGGACVNGRCKCDKFFGAEDAVDEHSELATRRTCILRRCNKTCTGHGYESARCVNGWCKQCRFTKYASPLNDETSDENEESNSILRKTEEELIVSSPRACNTVTCN